jgi:hypothetical protein
MSFRNLSAIGTAIARLATADEKIITILDGEVETINTAAEGDVVITGPKGEKYIINATKFEARYKGSTAFH